MPRSRKPWTSNVLVTQEDAAVALLVHELGCKCWTAISQQLTRRFGYKGRSAKQCRERWHNHLDPFVSKEPWSLEEQLVLVQAHHVYGNHWADIARHLPGRTDNAVKNHYYSTIRRRIRQLSKEARRKQKTIASIHIDPDQLFQAAILSRPTGIPNEGQPEQPVDQDFSGTVVKPQPTRLCTLLPAAQLHSVSN